MKSICISIAAMLLLSSGIRAQFAPIKERHSYSIFKVDSLLYLPYGNTVTRPAPITGNYWLRYNTDSSGFEYSTGSQWLLLSMKAPPEVDTIISNPTTVRDTTVFLGPSCGTQTCGYIHFHFPQYVGFQMRLYSGGGLIAQGLSCVFGINFYTWNSSTGDMYIWGVAGRAGSTNSYFQIAPYY